MRFLSGMEVRVSDVCKKPEGISGKEAVVIQVAPTGTVLISITVRKSRILANFKNCFPFSSPDDTENEGETERFFEKKSPSLFKNL